MENWGRYIDWFTSIQEDHIENVKYIKEGKLLETGAANFVTMECESDIVLEKGLFSAENSRGDASMNCKIPTASKLELA